MIFLKKLILLPIQLLFSNDYLKERGIRTVEDERIDIVHSYLKGKTLDIGCGTHNYLIKKYKNGFGIDITFYRNNDLCASVENLCFKDEKFETVAIIGTLDYFDNKEKALREINRVLKKEGQLIVTTLNPLIAKIRHTLAIWNKYGKPNRPGFWKKELIILLDKFNFKLKLHKTFICGLNNIYIFEKK